MFHVWKTANCPCNFAPHAQLVLIIVEADFDTSNPCILPAAFKLWLRKNAARMTCSTTMPHSSTYGVCSLVRERRHQKPVY